MPNIDLGEVFEAANKAEFWALRAKAIQAYANLEQRLFKIFTSFTGMDQETAGIVFFKITSSQARNKVIEKLFQKRHGANFNLFRNSLINQLAPIDQSRNEIVHWNTITNVNETGAWSLALVAPTPWTPNAESRDSAYLVAFIYKCDFYARLITMFDVMVMRPELRIPDADRQPWLEIFAQPITYPPPAGHPILPKPTAPEGDPPPTQHQQ